MSFDLLEFMHDPGAARMLAVDALKLLAAELPRRVILGERGPYLSRYTVREREDGGRVYLHHFHRSDADDALHSHPWAGRSTILTGGYIEERLGVDGIISKRAYLPGHVNHLGVETFHRVDLLDEAAGCWTLFETGPKASSWGFLDRTTRAFTPWRAALRARGLLPAEEP